MRITSSGVYCGTDEGENDIKNSNDYKGEMVQSQVEIGTAAVHSRGVTPE